jgi:hypothetical protein
MYFDVTILVSKAPKIADQKYTVGSSVLALSFDPFLILPANYEDVISIDITYKAYILTAGTKLPPVYIDLSCAGLSPLLETWIDISNL